MRQFFFCKVVLSGLTLAAVPVGLPAQAPTRPFRLDDGTPVKLRLNRTISSAEARVNDLVDFEVLEEVKVNEAVVIPKGSVALGKVTEAREKRRAGRGGKLQVRIESARLADGEKAPLRAVRDVKGAGKKGKMTAGLVATGIGFFPAAPLFLLMHGKEATVPKDTEFTAYIQGDIGLEPARFGIKTAGAQAPATAVQPSPPAQPASVPSTEAPQPSPPAQPTPVPTSGPPQSATTPQPAAATRAPASSTDQFSSVTMQCSPASAEIYVDGKFMGSTPSTVRLAPGEHVLVLERPGFKRWFRSLQVTPGGNVTIDATLEKAP